MKPKSDRRGSMKSQKREAPLCAKCRSEVVSDGDDAPLPAGQDVLTSSWSKTEEDRFLEWGNSLSQAYRGVDQSSAPTEVGGNSDVCLRFDGLEDLGRMSISEVASTVLTQSCPCSCHPVDGQDDYVKAGMLLDVCIQCNCFERWYVRS